MFQITNHFLHEQKTKLNNNKIFCKDQSGFRSNYSTDVLLLFLNNKTLRGFDNRPYPTMILIDLQKEFGTV